MVSFDVVTRAGHMLKHGLGVLLICWRRMLGAALFVGVAGFLLAEIVGALLVRRFPADIPAHVAALAFGLACGYGAALSILIDEMLGNLVEMVKWVGGEAEAGARAASIIAEREVGEMGGLLRVLAARPRRRTATSPSLATPGRQPAYVPESSETADDVAATEAFQSTAPRPRVNARPVPAGQLPRIEWAYERLGHGTPSEPGDDADPEPAPEMPPLPLKDAEADAARRPAEAHLSGAQGSEAAAMPALRIPRFSTPPPPSAPSSPSVAQPPDALAERGVWSRISRALVGQPLAESALTPGAVPESASMPETALAPEPARESEDAAPR